MANLNSWQKIDRVLLGQPFGDGKDGAYSSATIPTLVYKSCTGTADSTTLSADTDTSPFEVGDVLLLHQSRGTGVGQWEINRVTAVGTDEYTLQQALHYTYTDSGASQAQAIKIPRYTNVTCSGTWTVGAWGGTTGGILVFAANGTVDINGTITATGKGYLGGGAVTSQYATGNQGEGTSGSGSASRNANGNGGGGGASQVSPYWEGGGGGGGGNGTAGENAPAASAYDGLGGYGGSIVGQNDLTTIVFGGGGGAGGRGDDVGMTSGAGANGGGIVFIFGETVDVDNSTGSIVTNGNNGGNTSSGNEDGGGGGGSGGSSLLVVKTATLNTTRLTATAGSYGVSGDGSNRGGTGGVGRIAVHHSGPVTGTTSPSFTDVSDASLRESASMGYMI